MNHRLRFDNNYFKAYPDEVYRYNDNEELEINPSFTLESLRENFENPMRANHGKDAREYGPHKGFMVEKDRQRMAGDRFKPSSPEQTKTNISMGDLREAGINGISARRPGE